MPLAAPSSLRVTSIASTQNSDAVIQFHTITAGMYIPVTRHTAAESSNCIPIWCSPWLSKNSRAQEISPAESCCSARTNPH
jgi:hypothetical protein